MPLADKGGQPRGALFLGRPLAASLATEAALSRCGVPCFVEPLLRLHPVQEEPVPPLAECSVLAATSAAAAAFVPPAWRGVPVLAAGLETAAAFRRAGHPVTHAGETAAELISYILTKSFVRGPLVYAGAADHVTDVAAAAAAYGVPARFVALYRAEKAACLSRSAAFCLSYGLIGSAAVYSPRSAEAWTEACRTAGVAECLAEMPHFCISARAAGPLVDFVKKSFIFISESPARAGMERLIRRHYGTSYQRSGDGDDAGSDAQAKRGFFRFDPERCGGARGGGTCRPSEDGPGS